MHYYRFIVINRNSGEELGDIFKVLGPKICELYKDNDKEILDIANDLCDILAEMNRDLKYSYNSLINRAAFAVTDTFRRKHAGALIDLNKCLYKIGLSIICKEVELTINAETAYKDQYQIVYRYNHIEDNESTKKMHDMLDLARARGVTPFDLFELETCDEFVNATWFFDVMTDDKQGGLKNKIRKEILMNGSNRAFYRVLIAYLDSYGTKKYNYEKLEPALCSKKAGKLRPEDGKHRARLCMLLDIDLPVQIITKK